jgi:hypothetical protein
MIHSPDVAAARTLLRRALERGAVARWDGGRLFLDTPAAMPIVLVNGLHDRRAVIDEIVPRDDPAASYEVLRNLFLDPGELENEGKR